MEQTGGDGYSVRRAATGNRTPKIADFHENQAFLLMIPAEHQRNIRLAEPRRIKLLPISVSAFF
jgi:hypothetical protein